MAPSGVFEDTPAWEAGLRVHEAENKWLLRETLAVLSASKCYAKSLSGAPTAFDLGVDSLGGVLGALTSASAGAALAVGMEGMGFDGDAGGHHASAEANFAAALERVGHHGVSADDEEMSAPMAAAIGAPLLTPIADTLRAVGMLRESLGRRVHRALVGNLQAFIDEDIGSVTLMREKYEIEKAACDAARAKHLAQSSSSKGPGASQARVSAARDLAAAKESLDVARARLSLAQIALEGRRRYVLLEAARQTTAELRRFFAEASSALAGVDRELRDMEEYEMASRAQAEMKMESAARHMQRAFDGLADDTARDVPPPGDADGDRARGDDAASASAAASVFVPPGGAHAGRSADASIRRSLAIGVEALAAQTGDRAGPLRVGTIRAGYLSERNPGKFGGWTRRYFVLDGAGRFFVHGRGASRDASRDPSRAQKNASKDREEKAGSRAASALRGIGAAFAGVARAAAPEPAPGAGFGRAPVEATLSDAEIASDLTVSCVKHGPDPGDRAAADRPFCFRVIAPTGSTTLQAESEEEASAWVSDLQGVIAELISMGPRNPGFPGNAARETTTRRGDEKKGDEKHVALGANARKSSSGDGGGGGEPDPAEALARAKKEKETGDVSADSVRAALASVPGNAQCADCGAPDPDWASLNLVVMVCHRCAGAHRHLGAHVSKVRSASLDLDAWTPPVLSLFASVGNDRANDLWEARRRDGTVAPKVLRLEAAIKEGKDERGFAGKEPEHPPPVAFDCAGDPEATLAAVTRKYVARAHVKPATATVASCVDASASLDVPALLERLVRSSTDRRDAERVARERREGLLAAVARGEEAAPVAALLLMHGARVDGDGDGGDGDGGDGDGDGDGDGGGGGGEGVPPARLRLDVARRAREAGCPLDGSVFALLRAAAETQGVEF
jgi:hypothetical protein